MASKFKARVIPESIEGCGTTSRPQSVRTQWIPKDICCYQALVLLERHENTSSMILSKAVRYVQYKRFKKPNLKNKYLNQEHNQWNLYVWI